MCTFGGTYRPASMRAIMFNAGHGCINQAGKSSSNMYHTSLSTCAGTSASAPVVSTRSSFIVGLFSKLHIDTYARPHSEYRLPCLYQLKNKLEVQRTRVFTESLFQAVAKPWNHPGREESRP